MQCRPMRRTLTAAGTAQPTAARRATCDIQRPMSHIYSGASGTQCTAPTPLRSAPAVTLRTASRPTPRHDPPTPRIRRRRRSRCCQPAGHVRALRFLLRDFRRALLDERRQRAEHFVAPAELRLPAIQCSADACGALRCECRAGCARVRRLGYQACEYSHMCYGWGSSLLTVRVLGGSRLVLKVLPGVSGGSYQVCASFMSSPLPIALNFAAFSIA